MKSLIQLFSNKFHVRRSKSLTLLTVLLLSLAIVSYFVVSNASSPRAPVVAAESGKCTTTFQHGASVETAVTLSRGSTAQICVNYYYFSSGSPYSLAPANQIEVLGYSPVPNSNATRIADFSSDFSIQISSNITANSAGQLQIGGSNSVNEGMQVMYTISMKSNTPSGLYFVSINAALYPQLAYCSSALELLAGGASYQPAALECHSAASATNVPPNSDGFIDGLLFVEVSGISNSS